MKRDNKLIHLSTSFQDALAKSREAIVANGFLVLHEIDTQGILAKQGIAIAPIRQLLFFHPLYMQVILENAPEAVIEAPLKLAIQQVEEAQINIHFFDPVVHFEGYEKLQKLSRQLHVKTSTIVNMIKNATTIKSQF